MQLNDPTPTTRRNFLKTSTAATLGGLIAAPAILGTKSSAASPGDTIKVGVIGCGGRGNGAAADALAADSNTVLHAMGDLEASRIELGLREISKGVKEPSR